MLDNKGHFIPNIPTGNFRILEDDVPQKIETGTRGEAPMTVCLLMEFSNRFQWYGSEPWFQTLIAAYGFAQTLKPDDYVAVIAYDSDRKSFPTSRPITRRPPKRCTAPDPGIPESNLYDALVDTEKRMENIEGRKRSSLSRPASIPSAN